jgi:hypothetical protein
MNTDYKVRKGILFTFTKCLPSFTHSKNIFGISTLQEHVPEMAWRAASAQVLASPMLLQQHTDQVTVPRNSQRRAVAGAIKEGAQQPLVFEISLSDDLSLFYR